jgi:hypothetical protein
MKFRFPSSCIDEDFRAENTSGLGIRALAQAIESEGFEVLGVTSYGDLSQFAQQQSRASAFILSIDDEEFTSAPTSTRSIESAHLHRQVRRKNAEVPIYIYGETGPRAPPNDILRELHGLSTCSRTRRSSSRATSSARPRATSKRSRRSSALIDYAEDGSYCGIARGIRAA